MRLSVIIINVFNFNILSICIENRFANILKASVRAIRLQIKDKSERIVKLSIN